MILQLLAQATSDPGIGLDLILKSYGIAAPVILGLAAAIRVLWTRLQSAQDELSRVRDVQMEKVVPALIQNTDQLERSGSSLERAAELMHQLAGRPGVEPDTWRRVLTALEHAEDARRRGEH